MPRPHSSNSPEVLRGTHDCPKCGFPMLLAIIEKWYVDILCSPHSGASRCTPRRSWLFCDQS